ncbi:transposable element Tcb2 transposase [Trichonephila clavipes]|nr:transposable element Tcb2 transposase [Trichonephila clavipes]
MGPMHVKYVEAQTSSCWCGVEAKREGCNLRCRPRHLTMVQNDEVCHRKPSRRPRQTSRREDRHIVRNARGQPTASSAAIQAQVAPSLSVPVSSQTIQRRLAEGHLGSRHPLRVLPLTPTH